MYLTFIYIVIVYCQTWISMGELRCHQIQLDYSYLKLSVNVTDSYVAAQLCDLNGRP